MEEYLSPAGQRVLLFARMRATARAADVDPADLLAGLLADDQSRGAMLLLLHCNDSAALRRHFETPPPESNDLKPEIFAPELSLTTRRVLVRAREFALTVAGEADVGTEEILLAVFDVWEHAGALAAEFGLQPRALIDDFATRSAERQRPLAVDDPGLDLEVDYETMPRARLLDASLNRASEGLRVVEDYARFAIDDADLARRLKECRHELRDAAGFLPTAWRVAARDSVGDVGASIHTAAEGRRGNLFDVAQANIKRVQEALRTLEETAKIDNSLAAEQFGKLRYAAYAIEKALLTRVQAAAALRDDYLYWLAEPDACHKTFEWTAKEVLDAGVRLVQYREKNADDRTRFEDLRNLRRWTNAVGAKLIVNDRPDLARLVGADGVHVGQEDLPPTLVRTILGPTALVGLSTHDPTQLEQAARQDVHYIGVGPVFPSRTKEFAELAGLDYVRQSAAMSVPAFCIGGITPQNVHQVLEAGGERLAVGRAISESSEPSRIVRQFLSELGRL